jgi:cytochrome c biogenesis factor
LILVGELSLWVALLMAAWAAVVSFAGGVQRRDDLIESGARASYAALFLIVLASLGLWTALATRDFSLAHVAASSSANLPRLYTLAAFWSGPAGSLLLWALLVAACSVAAVRASRARHRELLPYVAGTLAVVLVFALLALCLAENPYRRIDWIPLDGRGMPPLLQQPGMTLHPPVLYFGLAATAVPLALTIASVLRGGFQVDTIEAIRRWIVVSWIALTAGILLGMWWAYVETGWSGAWTRDAVWSAALFSWAVNTVLLHSLGARGARGRMLRVNVALIAISFFLAIYSAFVADGGIISNAHGYSESPVRHWAIGFLVLAIGAIGYLLVTRVKSLTDVDAGSTESTLSGGFAPKLALPVVYAGMLLLIVGLAGQEIRKRYDVTLVPGHARELRDGFGRAWRFTGQGVSQYNELNRSVFAGAVDVGRGDRSVGIVTAEQRQYLNSRGEPTAEPWIEAATLGTMSQDVQVAVVEFGEDERVRARIAFNPLVRWVWIGGLVMLVGGAMPLFAPGRSET